MPLLEPLETSAHSICQESKIFALDLGRELSGVEVISQLMQDEGEALANELAVRGSCLIRGAGFKTVDDFESIWKTPFKPWAGYPFMEEGRFKKGTLSVSSNYRTAEWGAFTFHNENRFFPPALRPNWLAFFCHQAPARGGETALINMSGVFHDLSAGLVGKLSRSNVTNRFRIPAERWTREFGGSFKASEIQSIAERYNIKIRRLRTSSIDVEYDRAHVGSHKRSKEPTLFYSGDMPYPGGDAYKQFVSAFAPHHVEAYNKMGAVQRALAPFGHIAFRLLGWVKGFSITTDAKLNRKEFMELFTALSKHIVAVPYQLGDVLIIDNEIMQHTALPWKGDREISVIMGSY